jgi:Leucine-rich repeat (LRR) protein
MPSTDSWPDDPRIRRALEQARTSGILSLNGLGLKAVGDWIADFSALTELRLDSNRLVALPPAIGRLTKLRKLWLFGNGLRSLPPTLGQLTALEDLWLDENLLT